MDSRFYECISDDDGYTEIYFHRPAVKPSEHDAGVSPDSGEIVPSLNLAFSVRYNCIDRGRLVGLRETTLERLLLI